MSRSRNITIWIVLITVIAVPLILAAFSPQLQWRRPVYIIAGFAGIVAMVLLLVQPLLIGGPLPNLSARQSRVFHRILGSVLVIAVLIHVIGLWFTSPPDVIDALLFRSPTPFSVWGVIAMWLVFLTALLAVFRKRLKMRPYKWRLVHVVLAIAIIIGTIVHAALIEGTMESYSKVGLSILIVAAAIKVILDLRVKRLR